MPCEFILHVKQLEFRALLPQFLGDFWEFGGVLSHVSVCDLEELEGLVVLLEIGVLLGLEDGGDQVLRVA